MPPTDIAIHFQRALCRSRIAGNCECENDPTNPRARGMLCDRYLEQARALIAECGKEVRELLLASPSLPQPARDDPKWAALIDEKLRLASADILEMEGGKQHQRDPAIKYVLRLWEAAREHYDGLANATAEGQRKREIARRLCKADGFDADLVVMGYGPHPTYGPKGTACFTAPIHPAWCLYWRQAEAAIIAVEGEGREKAGVQLMAPQEIKDKAAVIYDDLRHFAGADFEIIFGCLSMVVACAECDLRFHNPEFSKEEIENSFNRRVSEISALISSMDIGLPEI